MAFDALLAELAPLAKAMAPEGDEKVMAAAEEAGADLGDGGEGEGEGEGDDDDVLGKSFAVTLPDGSVQQAFDASELVKSFGVRLEAAESATEQHANDLATAKDDLAKSFAVAETLVGIVKGQEARAKEQDALIKSLQADVARIGRQPAGRRAAVTLTERNPAPAVEGKVNPEAMMTKAMSLVGSGGLSSSDIACLEMSLQRNLPLPPHIKAALAA